MTDIGIPDAVIQGVLKDWGYGTGDSEPPAAETAAVEDAASIPTPDDDLDIEAGQVGDFDFGSDLTLVEDPGPDGPEPAADQPVDEVDDELPPSPPGGPLWEEPSGVKATPTAVTLPDGRVLDAGQLQALANLEQQIRSGQVPFPPAQVPAAAPPQPSPTVPAPAARPLPALPQLSEEDLESPAVQALIILAEQQHRQMEEIRQQQAVMGQSLAERRYQEVAEVTRTATSLYKQRYNLPDEVMDAVVRQAAPSSQALMQLYMSGTDPRTGQPVTPDAARAVEVVLDMAYWNTPEARRFEVERQTAHRQKATARKAKLGGIGGSSGSASRQPKPLDLSDPNARQRAMEAELAAAMGFGADE